MSEANQQLLFKARGRREQARQARRLSNHVVSDDDAARLLRYAERQEAAARRLEYEADAQLEHG